MGLRPLSYLIVLITFGAHLQVAVIEFRELESICESSSEDNRKFLRKRKIVK